MIEYFSSARASYVLESVLRKQIISSNGLGKAYECLSNEDLSLILLNACIIQLFILLIDLSSCAGTSSTCPSDFQALFRIHQLPREIWQEHSPRG